MSNTVSPSLIHRLQLDVAARLEGASAFQYVPITVVHPLDANEATLIDTRIDQQLAGLLQKGGKAGLAAMVMMPTLNGAEGNLPGPQMDTEVVVRIIENPLINRGTGGVQVSPEELSLTVAALLHHWTPRGGMLLRVAEREGITSVEVKQKIAWDIKLVSPFPVNVQQALGRPLIQVNEETGEVTMTAADGAAIRYTLDGSYPTGSSTLYTAPFVPGVEGEFSVRAIAQASGFLDSSPATVELFGEESP